MHSQKLLKAQKQMEQLQQHIAELSCEGAVSDGMVRVTVSGNSQVISVDIEPDAMELDRNALGLLIVAASNLALEKVQDELAKLRHELAAQVNAMT